MSRSMDCSREFLLVILASIKGHTPEDMDILASILDHLLGDMDKLLLGDRE